MIINGSSLLKAAPITDMLETKERLHGVSHGLAEAGYDIRIKQDIEFCPLRFPSGMKIGIYVDGNWTCDGKFILASTIEHFEMPDFLVGVVHDKSTWARKGLSVFNTVIEPGWKGNLTLELVYHGSGPLRIPAGSGIAQVLFSTTMQHAQYEGKYQNQADEPVDAIFEIPTDIYGTK